MQYHCWAVLQQPVTIYRMLVRVRVRFTTGGYRCHATILPRKCRHPPAQEGLLAYETVHELVHY